MGLDLRIRVEAREQDQWRVVRPPESMQVDHTGRPQMEWVTDRNSGLREVLLGISGKPGLPEDEPDNIAELRRRDRLNGMVRWDLRNGRDIRHMSVGHMRRAEVWLHSMPVVGWVPLSAYGQCYGDSCTLSSIARLRYEIPYRNVDGRSAVLIESPNSEELPELLRKGVNQSRIWVPVQSHRENWILHRTFWDLQTRWHPDWRIILSVA